MSCVFSLKVHNKASFHQETRRISQLINSDDTLLDT